MKIGECGQITIPKEFREKYGLKPNTEVELNESKDGRLFIKKISRGLNLLKWKGYCQKNLEKLGIRNTDDLIEELRGR